MRILMVSSEVAPFAKTGGLADVVAALPQALTRQGHDVRIMMPLFRSVDRFKYRLLPILRKLVVRWGGEEITGELMRCSYPCRQEIPVYFIQQEQLFGRRGFYGDSGGDYGDNDRRFSFLSLASLYALKALDWRPDIIHLHDWQTGLVAPLVRHHPAIANDLFYSNIRTVFTIHNLAYQGIVSPAVIENMQLPWSVFRTDGMEFHKHVSLLKAGIVFSDWVTTVSPTYAKEIQTPEGGQGMDGVLRERSDRLTGILNGIDTEVWNPESDPWLAAPYSTVNTSGKARCKAALQNTFCLSPEPETPLFGCVSRLVDQKGFDLIQAVLPSLLEAGAQFVLLGSGDPAHEEWFSSFAAANPGRVGVSISYSEQFAHMIEGGSDVFLMPSLFEPSGLNQLYSMRYGTIPVVRNVGGLADSVTDATEAAILNGTGTGFVFDEYTPDALWGAIKRSLILFNEDRASWRRLVSSAMNRDSSWNRSAAVYEDVYDSVLEPVSALRQA